MGTQKTKVNNKKNPKRNFQGLKEKGKPRRVATRAKENFGGRGLSKEKKGKSQMRKGTVKRERHQGQRLRAKKKSKKGQPKKGGKFGKKPN